ncbi:MAG: riboflavin biosynthesis protein RibF [Lentisphaerota bacterium]
MITVKQSLADMVHRSVPVVLAIGMFDGVHKGHQEVIHDALKTARALNAETWVLTLDPHPLKILKPEIAPALLTSIHHKLRLLDSLGVEGCIVLPFTRERADEEPETFVADLCRFIPGLKALVVGENWTFGRRARGTPAMLKQMSEQNRIFSVSVVPPVMSKNEPISSTRVRKAVFEGRLDEARDMLARPFSILGNVIPGKQFGRTMGFPTANVDPHNEVQPPPGVYAAILDVEGRRYNGAAFRPEGGEYASMTEIHLFDFSGDLYGKEVELFFIRFIRPIRHFPDTAQLRDQIALDVETIKVHFAG